MNAEQGGFVAGNQKNLNMTLERSVAWADEFSALPLDTIRKPKLQLVLFPPFSAAATIRQRLLTHPNTKTMIEEGQFAFGGQDLSHVEGETVRFTGSHHPNLLKDLCMTHVLVGHSERRQHAGESNEVIAQKLAMAFTYGLNPILCVGETLGEYDAKKTQEVIRRQLSVLDTLQPKQRKGMTIAYEPVWAIGTRRTAKPAEANDVCGMVRGVSGAARVIYGGSVMGANAAEFFKQSEIDGALPGGASENASEFFKIATEAANLL